MKRIVLLTAIVVPAFAVLAAQASSAPPAGSSNLTISAQPTSITFGQATTIAGKLKGPKDPITVTLHQNPYPFTDAFDVVGTKPTADNGDYSFTGIRPAQNTRYRVTTAAPALASEDVDVLVRIKVVLRVSDSTPRTGQLVRFHGTAAPQHDGRTVRLQRQTSTGSWTTVARTSLRDSGEERSTYSRRMRVNRDGVYRARVYRDLNHATGTSGSKTLDAH